jgi:dephospho-CoA kinase
MLPFHREPDPPGPGREWNQEEPASDFIPESEVARLIIGVTGNIASGKSETARLLQQKGCALVDADAVAHELYGYDRALVQQLGAEFGGDVLLSNGTLNRKKLGSLVFGRPDAMAALNRIVHPALINAIRERIRSSQRVMNRLILDAALIVELGFAKEVDYLVFVSAATPVRLARLMERSGLTEDEAMRRIDSQMPEESKLQHADFIIKNETTKEYLGEQVDALWDEILVRDSHADESRG